MALFISQSAIGTSYNDALIAPPLGTTNVQGAIDILKSGSTPSSPVVNAVCGEAGGMSAGQAAALVNSAGSPVAVLADANGAGNRVNAIGIVQSSVTFGNTATIQVLQEIAIADGFWTSVPVATDVGSPVYLSETAGSITLTAPVTAGSIVQQIGIVSSGGAGSSKIIIQLGPGTLI